MIHIFSCSKKADKFDTLATKHLVDSLQLFFDWGPKMFMIQA